MQSEIIQTVGRLRAHLRPLEPLKYYFCADYDLSFLLEHSLKVTTLDAFEITPLAGTPTQMGRWAAIELLQKLPQQGLTSRKSPKPKLHFLSVLLKDELANCLVRLGVGSCSKNY